MIEALITVVLFVLALAAYIALRAIGSVAGKEAEGWLRHLARGLIEGGCDRLPPAERERWREEWLADLAAYADRPLSALRFAVRTRLAARAVSRELAVPQAAPARTRKTPSDPAAAIASSAAGAFASLDRLRVLLRDLLRAIGVTESLDVMTGILAKTNFVIREIGNLLLGPVILLVGMLERTANSKSVILWAGRLVAWAGVVLAVATLVRLFA